MISRHTLAIHREGVGVAGSEAMADAQLMASVLRYSIICSQRDVGNQWRRVGTWCCGHRRLHEVPFLHHHHYLCFFSIYEYLLGERALEASVLHLAPQEQRVTGTGGGRCSRRVLWWNLFGSTVL